MRRRCCRSLASTTWSTCPRLHGGDGNDSDVSMSLNTACANQIPHASVTRRSRVLLATTSKLSSPTETQPNLRQVTSPDGLISRSVVDSFSMWQMSKEQLTSSLTVRNQPIRPCPNGHLGCMSAFHFEPRPGIRPRFTSAVEGSAPRICCTSKGVSICVAMRQVYTIIPL
jgi:hypothetical protein